MAKTAPFDSFIDDYEAWFDHHRPVFLSELNALSQVVRPGLTSIEIGVGSGIFAEPLGISEGVEPSPVMAERARKRGVTVYPGTAEHLPLSDGRYDLAVMITAICFVDDRRRTVEEIYRVLRPGGRTVFGFVDKDSELGKTYERFKNENVFYRDATFVTANEIRTLLAETGFEEMSVRQTVFGRLDSISEPQPARPGSGEGGFVVIEAVRER